MTSNTTPPTKQWLEVNCRNTGRFDILWENVDRHWEVVEKSGSMIAQLQQDLDRRKAENDALQAELDKLKGCAAQSCDRNQLADRIRQLECEVREKQNAIADAEAKSERAQEELAKQTKAAADAKAQAKKAQEELAKQKSRLGGRIGKLTDKVKEQAAKLAKGVKVITKFSRQVVTKTVERVVACGRIVSERVARYRRHRHWGRRVRYHKM
ncbi:hypothetical protein M758_3G186000 [Ceratodon purpureus]|uniref:Uncharacterized protein n=1 Tax=Ceratodon purpureus TaxID=3225 RepID=A0A8T0IMQ0_CERPU|nr:hypothetical protein KC19_3G187100 [Ceratodon purpureus]KAG0623594.1 hypothetical protein M758_3G186000 [Ceratodon purpureus]